MARYAGRRGVVYMSVSGSTVATNVVSLTSWSLSMAQDMLDVSAFLDTNKVKVAGLRDLTGSFEGLWDDTQTQIFAGASSNDGVRLYLYPSADAPTKYAAGLAWVDASLNTGVNDAVKLTANFAAKDSWTILL